MICTYFILYKDSEIIIIIINGIKCIKKEDKIFRHSFKTFIIDDDIWKECPMIEVTCINILLIVLVSSGPFLLLVRDNRLHNETFESLIIKKIYIYIYMH